MAPTMSRTSTSIVAIHAAQVLLESRPVLEHERQFRRPIDRIKT